MSLSMFSLESSVALVTGAGGGIGSAIAVGLAEAGADVACVDRAGDALETTAARVREAGRRALALVADTTDHDAMASVVAQTERDLGPLRHAVNCAGINSSSPASEMPLEQWTSVVDTNLTGVFLSCQAEGRAMIAGGGGSIVNIGSVSASIANRGLTQVHYNAAKAGVIHLTTSLALEWAPLGIRVNALSPGYTRTPMATNPEVWEHVKAYAKDIPLGRWAEPEEMVGPAVFLLSAASSYCTGSNLVVDGGCIYW